MKISASVIFPAILLTFFWSCQKPSVHYPESSEISGLASPILLHPQHTIIYLEDYFVNTNLIDSIILPLNLKGSLSSDKKEIQIHSINEFAPHLMVMKVWIAHFQYSLLVKKPREVEYKFRFDPKGKTFDYVSIAGELNAWNPVEGNLSLINGIWERSFYVTPGKYAYRLVLDGVWQLDPNNPDSVDNNMGGYNSVFNSTNDQKGKKPVLLTKAFEDWNIAIGIQNQAEQLIVFWENFEIPGNDVLLDETVATFKIPNKATKMKRSWIRVWSSNAYGESNDLLIPLEDGKVISDPNKLSREDWEASVFYFLMVDRFNNGNPENDKIVDDPEILPKANYFGGDISGVIQKINDGYFKEIGINTIWLSPITQNPLGAYGLWPTPRTKFSGYHGYWPVSSTDIDFRFGNETELVELIETAHQNNMNVVLDYVANHVHELHPVYRKHPDWATSLYLPDGTLNTEKWDEHRLTTWFDTFLPTLDLENPKVAEVMTDSALYWMTHYNIDGFRHDATKHIPETFWRKLTKKLKENVSIPQNKRIYQVGETYGTPKLIGSYVSSGMLDAQFDFNVYDDAINVFARDKESFKRLSESLVSSLEQYGYHNVMGNISGNQDRPRFISLASGDVKFEEDTKLAGWTRDIGVKDSAGYNKLQSLLAFNMTIPGIPTIYYGDEFGMPGGNDPDNRRQMRFDSLSELEIKTRGITKKLVQIRRNNMSFLFGDLKILFVDDEVLVYSRSYFDKTGIVIFNKSGMPGIVNVTINEHINTKNLEANFGSKFNLVDGALEVFMDACAFEILTN
jgi:glycosidase